LTEEEVMKTKKPVKKLVFSKETVARLDRVEMLRAVGLGDDDLVSVPTYCITLCGPCTDTCGSAIQPPVCPCKD